MYSLRIAQPIWPFSLAGFAAYSEYLLFLLLVRCASRKEARRIDYVEFVYLMCFLDETFDGDLVVCSYNVQNSLMTRSLL